MLSQDIETPCKLCGFQFDGVRIVRLKELQVHIRRRKQLP